MLRRSLGKGGYRSQHPHHALLQRMQSTFTSIPTALGTHISTPKQEVCDRSGLLCGMQGPASVFERDLGASHRSLLSQHLRGWAAPWPHPP